MLVDYRCPNCNQTVDTHNLNVQEVRILKQVPKNPPSKCLHCQTKIKLLKSPDEGLGEEYHFDTQKDYQIRDWAGSKPYGDKVFAAFDDAWGFLSEDQRKRHPNATDQEFETILGEFNVEQVD